ncbi:MAG: class I SAM-dependent methyltransferase [Bacteroidota bacterium]|nr:class I SAM-dependent methyltransferase [Bacteroidota bacterium]MDP4214878.1 class I SAM-dependent methyltransferase [Bacteroidota bacterium]MDP4244740.1 class I SAM-dependent methyltransferase [Bacteroidota bacterium]MDP4252400.1 class I SAM-dependent methyltransferase [Bacteroidota bacterium]MDP4257957.1 class I SAM-dependent methyltransferase [Bacteroidota bacterium]
MIKGLNPVRRIVNPKFSFLRKYFGKQPFRLLDVGAGNHSAAKVTALFPNCEYYGLDMDRQYNNDDGDFRAMKGFFELDLTRLDYSVIPDRYFDGMLMAHVIEHLPNGDEVLPRLLTKLKPGGYFYIEYPGAKSLSLPSMRGTLNFKDDPTHVRVYSVAELRKIFEAEGCTVLAAGTRRSIWNIIATPARMLNSLVRTGHLRGNIFWDLLGFAEYLQVRKNPGQAPLTP